MAPVEVVRARDHLHPARAAGRSGSGASGWVASARELVDRLRSGIDARFGILSVLPATLVMTLVFGAPLAVSLYLSFMGWSPTDPLYSGRFVGLANYADLLNDPAFVRSVVLTLAYTAVVVAAELALGLAIALLLNLEIPLIGMFRALLIVPMMMTPIVAARSAGSFSSIRAAG